MLLPQIVMFLSAIPTLFNWLKLKLASRDPKSAQEKCLKRIINQHANTSFGMQHNFRKIDDHEAYVDGACQACCRFSSSFLVVS